MDNLLKHHRCPTHSTLFVEWVGTQKPHSASNKVRADS